MRINPDDNVHDIDVGDVTGIVLGNSAIDKPGFADATLLSQIQAMSKKLEITDEPKWELSFNRTRQGEQKFILEKEA